MQSQTKTSTPTQLPVMKYFEDSKIMDQGKELLGKWRKGEKPIGAILGLGLLGVAGWATVKYALPIVFTMLGQVTAVILSVALVALAIMMSPVIYKLFRRIVRSLHKMMIEWDPFEELEDQKVQLWKNHEKYLANKAKIKETRSDFEQRSEEAKQKAQEASEEVQSQTRKAEKLKKDMEEMIAAEGESVKETDGYVELQNKFINATSAGTRANTTMTKNIEWSQKYAVRSNIFGNLDRKLSIGATVLENKIKDFEESIDIMKQEFIMAKSARGATDILKQVLGPGGENWKLEYAVDFIQSRIAEDIAQTAQNLEDLERNTAAFNFDSDEAYEKLLSISEKLDTNQITMPETSRISNPNHKLTAEEKKSAGPLGGIFN